MMPYAQPNTYATWQLHAAAAMAAQVSGVGGSEPDPFTPDDLTGLVLWLEYDFGTYQDTVGGTVAGVGDTLGAWEDQSGQAHHLTQSATLRKPTVAADGIDFNSDDFMDIADMFGIVDGQARTVFVRVKLNNAGNRQMIAAFGNSANGTQTIGIEANTFASVGSRWGMYATGRTYDSAGATSTNTVTLAVVFASTTSGSSIIANTSYYVDGTLQALTRVSGPNNDFQSQAGFDTFTIGVFPTTTVAYLNGTIESVIVYDRALNATERGQVETYLDTI